MLYILFDFVLLSCSLFFFFLFFVYSFDVGDEFAFFSLCCLAMTREAFWSAHVKRREKRERKKNTVIGKEVVKIGDRTMEREN